MRLQKLDVEICRLPSGLLTAAKRCPRAAVEYCGIVVRAGSRDDGADHPGLAHFVEHTIFKGTERRSSWHIINRMERVGGELNAYTTKEETVVYAAAPAGNAARALELIADLASNSRFPDSELNKEREVVADEINSYLDSPADAVFDDFEDLLFAGTDLGHNILGTTEALEGFDSALCRQYLKRWYAADNMAVFYCGPMAPDRFSALAAKHFASLPLHAAARQPSPAPQAKPFASTKRIGAHQAHTVMGCLTPGMRHPGRFAMALLTNVLGGPGMNSLLNVALREKRGLVYSVDASASRYTDCGQLAIYFGCDPSDTERCAELARQQIDSLCQQPMKPAALAMAKKQYLGQLAVASDNHENGAIAAGRAALFYGNMLSPAQVRDIVMNITASELMETAQSISTLSSLTLQ